MALSTDFTLHPIETIKNKMRELDLKPKHLAEILGHHRASTRVYALLNKRTLLKLREIRCLHKELDISLSILIREYRLRPKNHKKPTL